MAQSSRALVAGGALVTLVTLVGAWLARITNPKKCGVFIGGSSTVEVSRRVVRKQHRHPTTFQHEVRVYAFFERSVVTPRIPTRLHTEPATQSLVLTNAGSPLSVTREWTTSVPAPVPATITFLRELETVLAALHTAGVVHNDLRPVNVLVMDAVVTLCDFEKSLFLAPSPTFPDAKAATPDASPFTLGPERCASLADARDRDWYSWAVIGFYLLTQRLPYHPSGRAGYELLQPRVLRELLETAAGTACPLIATLLARLFPDSKPTTHANHSRHAFV